MAQPDYSFVPMTDSAAATRKIATVQRTVGADTVEEYLQSISEPFLPAYRASSATTVALATANSHIVEVMAGASLRVGIRRIRVYQVVGATSTGNDVWALYRLSSAGTGGTAVTPAPLDPADSACGATVMLLPSSKGTETTLIDYFQVLPHATETTVGINPLLDMDFEWARTKGLWIAAGASNGIALKNITADASATVRVVVDLVESDWT